MEVIVMKRKRRINWKKLMLDLGCDLVGGVFYAMGIIYTMILSQRLKNCVNLQLIKILMNFIHLMNIYLEPIIHS